MALTSPSFQTRHAFRAFVIALLALAATIARGELRFDVFIGYDGTVREATWFPVTCEILNDGATFEGVIEISASSFGDGEAQQFPIELPTGTTKRVVIPAFAPSRYPTMWDVRLIDSRGKTRAESVGLRPQRQVGWETKLMGALPRTAAGMVSIRSIKRNQPDIQPAAARFQPAMFPDNPLVLEALDAIYLNSETAVALRSSQANALLAWMNAGGHLIVAVEQISDVSGVPWLRNVLPVEPQDIVAVSDHTELDQWLHRATMVTNYPAREPKEYFPSAGAVKVPKNNPPTGEPTVQNAFGDPTRDAAFEATEIRVVTGRIRDGKTVLSVAGKPLMVTANRGLGRITTLMFSPEREPFKSWKDLPSFWTVMLEVPLELYISSDFNSGYGQGIDGFFGAMIDSRQVHKLPVEWLLVLLVVYLLVIGPVDRMWLKKINRPMLTWVTFPCYVLLFSGLIYFIGYRLRAGDSEYNELHVVDVLPNGDQAQWRGRTYASIYSPANARYAMQSELKYATFRGEYLGSRGGESSQKATLLHTGDNFKAEVLVPVWTSQLFTSDWWQSGEQPLTAAIKNVAGGWQVTVENRSSKPIAQARLVLGEYIYDLGEIAPRAEKEIKLASVASTRVEDFVNNQAHHYANVAQQRQYAFGGRRSGQLDDLPMASMVTSLMGQMATSRDGNDVVMTPRLDVSRAATPQRAILLAWAPEVAPVAPLARTKTKRTAVNTLWRLPVTVPIQN